MSNTAAEATLELGAETGNVSGAEDVSTGGSRRALAAKFKYLRFIVTIGLFAWLGWRMDWQRVAHDFEGLRLDLWLGAVLLYILAQVVSGYRWKLLAEPLGFKGSWTRFTSLYFIGMFFNMFLPTSVGGDVVRALYLDARRGHRLRALVSVLVDRASGLLVLLMVACVAMATCTIALPWWIGYEVWGATAAAFAFLAALPLLTRWSAPETRIHRLAASSQIYLRHPKLILVTTLLSLFVQAANVVLVWLIGLAMHAPIPASYYWIMVPMVTLLTLLPSINGMGIRESCTILFLAPLGIPDDMAFSLAFCWFITLTAASLVGGAVYVFGSYPFRVEEQAQT
jgi:uncharacterized membrane protein YbhN (UPF0104 family)